MYHNFSLFVLFCFSLTQISISFYQISTLQTVTNSCQISCSKHFTTDLKVKTIIHFIFNYFITKTGAKQNWLLATCYDHAESVVWQEYWFWDTASNGIQVLLYFIVFICYEFAICGKSKVQFWWCFQQNVNLPCFVSVVEKLKFDITQHTTHFAWLHHIHVSCTQCVCCSFCFTSQWDYDRCVAGIAMLCL